tara:strand:+ start:368 stop:994 length:627 start_codon:yes stop_codon:yes gene_type:complete
MGSWIGGLPVYAGSMGGGMMRSPEGMQDMKGMMQRMMGDLLPPGIDPVLLPEPQSQGASLLARYCNQCHQLPGPGMHTASEWPAVVERMNRRMQMMGGRGMMGMMMVRVEALAPSELQVLVRYLQTHAQRPIDRAQYSDLNTPAGQAFEASCSRCHVLPDPQQHTSDEWPGVVARMKKNMAAMGKTVPDEATLGEVITFLQNHAQRGE